MLEFPSYIYEKALRIADLYNVTADCRNYPSLLFNMIFGRGQIDFSEIKNNLAGTLVRENFPYGLYISLPFCKGRCTFCKYYSEPRTTEQINNYLRALEEEIKSYSVDFRQTNLKNIYFGGGTPTLLNPEQINFLKQVLERHFGIEARKGQIQIALEGTPESIKKEEMGLWKDLGVNRVSLGVQTFNEKTLKACGRFHGSGDIFSAFKIMEEVGIKYKAIDLIIGLPGEKREDYLNTIEQTIKLNPDFIECFLFKTGGLVNLKKTESNLDKEEILSLFEKELILNGYRIHFKGNFLGFLKQGADPRWVNNQNTEGVYNFKTGCLGIGAGAQTHFKNFKYIIWQAIADYEKIFFGQRPPDYYGFNLSPDDAKRQYVIAQIGYYRVLKKSDYRFLFGSEFAEDFCGEIELLKKKNLILEEADKFIFYLKEIGLGHEDFFLHVLKFWYHPTRLGELIKLMSKAPCPK